VLSALVTARASWNERASWALYDFANTIFSMNVATLYFSVWLIADLGASNTVYALGNGMRVLLFPDPTKDTFTIKLSTALRVSGTITGGELEVH